jgi:hypothetical protein
MMGGATDLIGSGVAAADDDLGRLDWVPLGEIRGVRYPAATAKGEREEKMVK